MQSHFSFVTDIIPDFFANGVYSTISHEGEDSPSTSSDSSDDDSSNNINSASADTSVASTSSRIHVPSANDRRYDEHSHGAKLNHFTP